MKYDLRLSTGLSINDVEAEVNLEDLENLITNKAFWLKDNYGWKINPAHIVLIRPVEDENGKD